MLRQLDNSTTNNNNNNNNNNGKIMVVNAGAETAAEDTTGETFTHKKKC